MPLINHTVQVNPITFVPRGHTQGDNDFWGKVDIHVWARVHVRDDRRAFRIEYGMSATEAGWDYTTVVGSAVAPEYVLPGPGVIKDVLTGQSQVRYRDTTWEKDVFLGQPNELVARWVIQGDRNGPDVGFASMSMEFNPVVLRIDTGH